MDMKRSFMLGMSLLIIFTLLSTCNKTNNLVLNNEFPYFLKYDGNHFLKHNENPAPLDVQYIRTTWSSRINYPIIRVISSRHELEQYNNISYAFEKYSANYFEDNFLVIVLLQENSGSVRHEVIEVDASGNIVIKRLLPEIGTTDMAAWYIIIGLNNNFRSNQFQTIFIDVKN